MACRAKPWGRAVPWHGREIEPWLVTGGAKYGIKRSIRCTNGVYDEKNFTNNVAAAYLPKRQGFTANNIDHGSVSYVGK